MSAPKHRGTPDPIPHVAIDPQQYAMLEAKVEEFKNQVPVSVESLVNLAVEAFNAGLSGETNPFKVSGNSEPRFPNYREGETCQGCGGAKCVLDCDRPYDQFESRWCSDCDKYRSTCANDHCLICGSST